MANVDRLLLIDIFTDDDVEPQNRVSLSTAYPPDEHGAVPKIEIKHRNRSPRTIANREFLVEKRSRLLRSLGAKKSIARARRPSSFTVIRRCALACARGDSVLDANGEARFVKRLFVADNSALANGLGGPNPTLTTQALATRTAEKIFTRYFGGRSWVDRESPISSIDPSVTRWSVRPCRTLGRQQPHSDDFHPAIIESCTTGSYCGRRDRRKLAGGVSHRTPKTTRPGELENRDPPPPPGRFGGGHETGGWRHRLISITLRVTESVNQFRETQ